MSDPHKTPAAKSSVADAELQPAERQFLERSFPEWLNLAGVGSEVEALEHDGAKLLRWLHQQVFLENRPIDSIRNDLFAANGATRFIAISSGKGGVGKTTFSLNLSHAIAALGFRVLLVDADLGLGNVHVFAGINPAVTIQDFLDQRLSLAATLTPVSENLSLLCGGSGVAGLASLGHGPLNRLLRHLRALQSSFDLVLLDTGAGLSPQVLNFLVQAQEIVIVTTPNIAATLDAYGLVKTIHEQHMSANLRLLINHVEDQAEACDTHEKIADCARHFLNIDPSLLGFLTRDQQIEKCNQERRPFFDENSTGANSQRLLEMARLLTQGIRAAAPELRKPATAPLAAEEFALR